MGCVPTININLNLPFLSIPKAILSILGKIYGFVNGIINFAQNFIKSIVGILKSIVDKFKEALKNIKNLIPNLIKSLKSIFNLKNIKVKLNIFSGSCDVLGALNSKVRDFLNKYAITSFRDFVSKLGLSDFSKIVNSILNVDVILQNKLNELLRNLESFARIPGIPGIASVTFECVGLQPTAGSGYYQDWLSIAGMEMPQLKLPECRDDSVPCSFPDKLKDDLANKKRQDLVDDINKKVDLGILPDSPFLKTVKDYFYSRYNLQRKKYRTDENGFIIEGVEDINISNVSNVQLSAKPIVSASTSSMYVSGDLTFDGKC